jgi:hypothetical protein
MTLSRNAGEGGRRDSGGRVRVCLSATLSPAFGHPLPAVPEGDDWGLSC